MIWSPFFVTSCGLLSATQLKGSPLQRLEDPKTTLPQVTAHADFLS